MATSSTTHRRKTAKNVFYVALACNYLAALFGCCGVATGIAGAAAVDWWSYESDNMTGLFQGYNVNTSEYFNLDAVGFTEDWLYAVRAFFILMIIVGGTGDLFSIVSLFRRSIKLIALASAGLLFVAGIFGIVACAVFSSETDDVVEGYWYGTGYALGWVSCWFFFIAGVLQGATGGTIESYDVT